MAAPLKGLFVTGTGVGKTEVAAALARLLIERGVSKSSLGILFVCSLPHAA